MIIQLNDMQAKRTKETQGTMKAPVDGWTVTAWTLFTSPATFGFTDPSKPRETYFVSTLTELIDFIKQWAEEGLSQKDNLPPLPVPTGHEKTWHGDLRPFQQAKNGRVQAVHVRKVRRGQHI